VSFGWSHLDVLGSSFFPTLAHYLLQDSQWGKEKDNIKVLPKDTSAPGSGFGSSYVFFFYIIPKEGEGRDDEKKIGITKTKNPRGENYRPADGTNHSLEKSRQAVSVFVFCLSRVLKLRMVCLSRPLDGSFLGLLLFPFP